MKLLTFLGIAKYAETTYVWQNRTCTISFAPAASCYFLQPNSVTVFLTEDAQQQVFPAFRAALPVGLPLQAVPVPLGSDERELWEVFERVSTSVQPGEEVAFDITHGLRSFPLIGLLAAAFLRSGLDIKLRAVLYGAYDVRDQSVTPNRTPMFDLTPMIGLLEWATAADRFNRSGDARYLASLLKQVQKGLAQEAQGKPEMLSSLTNLNNLSSALKGISQGSALIRPHQIMEQVAKLPGIIQKAQPVLAQAASGQPLNLLLESIVAAYQPLAYANPYDVLNLPEILQIERRMIHWYMEREHWVQAVSLAREWLVSWMMAQLGITPETSSAERHRVEGFVNTEAEAYLQAKLDKREFVPIFLRGVPEVETSLSLWKSLTDTRNDIDHAGMREDPGESEALIGHIKKHLTQLDSLPV